MRIVYQLHDKAHAEACQQRVYQVAHGGTDTCHEAKPTPFVQGALYAKHAYGTHRCGTDDANNHSFDYDVEEIEGEIKRHIWHNGCKITEIN